jgi:hypothetical protein
MSVDLSPPGFPSVAPLPAPHPLDDVRARPVAPAPESALRRARAVAQVLFASPSGPPDAERMDWLMADFANFLMTAPGRARWILQLSLFAVSVVAPLLIFRLAPLGLLSVPSRIRALERFEHSVFSPALLAVKAILCFMWFEHPRTRAELDLPATCKKGPL